MQVFIAGILIISNQSIKMDILSIYSKLTSEYENEMIISVTVINQYKKEYPDFILRHVT